jgi:hypothetical protein
VAFFIERIGLPLPAGDEARVVRIPHDPEKPRASVPAGERSEVSQCSQDGILHDIFGILVVPHEPACQSISGVEVRQDDRVEGVASSIGSI